MHPRERLAYSPIEGRRPLKLPDGLRLIVWPVLALEEWDMPNRDPNDTRLVTPLLLMGLIVVCGLLYYAYIGHA